MVAEQVVDLSGRALVPGFQDAHAHPAFAGVTMVSCNLIGCATLEQAEGRIEAYVAANPEQDWISGSGWRMEWFERGTPSRQQLDKLTGGGAAVLGAIMLIAGPIFVPAAPIGGG